MLAHIHFRRKDGSWSFILRERFPLFVEWVKEGKISVVDAETISAKEATILAREKFSLVPDEIVVEIGSTRQLIKVFNIEMS